MNTLQKRAIELHRNVPHDWYARSIRDNIFQRFWHNKRFSEVGKLIENSGGIILDVGCADGTLTKVILKKSRAKKIIGIDVLKKSIEFAKKRFARNKRMVFRVADAHNLPFKDNFFAAIVCFDTLEHFIDPIRVLREICRVLKKDGYTVILVPSESLLFRVIWWVWQKLPGKNIWQHTHLHDFSHGFLEKLLTDTSFTITVNKNILFGMLHAVKAVKQ